MDKVLVGGESVQTSIERKDLVEFLATRERHDSRPGKQSSCFFYTHRGSSWKYTSQASRYTGEIGTDTLQVGQSKICKPGTDPAVKEQLETVIKNAEEAIRRIKPELETLEKENEKLQSLGHSAGQRLKDAKRAKADWAHFKVKLDNQKDKVAEAEDNASKDNVKEKKNLKLKIQKLVDNSITMNENAGKIHNEIMKSTTSLTGLKMSEDGLHESLRKLT